MKKFLSALQQTYPLLALGSCSLPAVQNASLATLVCTYVVTVILGINSANCNLEKQQLGQRENQITPSLENH